MVHIVSLLIIFENNELQLLKIKYYDDYVCFVQWERDVVPWYECLLKVFDFFSSLKCINHVVVFLRRLNIQFYQILVVAHCSVMLL